VITPVFAPLSIPSPPIEWQSFNLGQWLRDIGLTWFPFDTTIRAYAIAILIGIVAAVILTSRRLTARGAEPGVVLDFAIWSVPLGIVGARIFHVLTHPNDYFGPGKDLWEIIRIDHGGIAIFGALLGGSIGVLIASRITGIRFTAFADALAPGLLLAQAFGRLGNYFNHELYGQPTDLPWGLEIESSNAAYPVGLPAGTLFHPTFLYEIVWNVLGVLVLIYLTRRWTIEKKTTFGASLPVLRATGYRLQWGKLIAVYLIWYGAGRMVWETIRVDPSEIFFGIRSNVWAAMGAVILGIIILVVQSRRHYGDEPSVYRPGRQWVPVVDSDETYSETDESGNDAVTLSETLAPSEAATSGTGQPKS
jgi:prolipoprotein diacylglyceryl transferase